MILNKLSLQPKQHHTLKEPLRIFFGKSKTKEITHSEFEIICDTLSKRKTPLVITGKQINGKSGKLWIYQLQMPTYSLQLTEGDSQNSNLVGTTFSTSNGSNRGYNNRYQQLFFLEVPQGIYLVYRHEAYYISPDGTWRSCDEDDHVDWSMSPEGYDDMIDRMRSYFEGEDEYVRSQRVSDNMRFNVMTPFDQYTQKEHEFETQKVDFTKGVRYSGVEAAGHARGKKISYALSSNDISADPENCTLAVGQQVAIYREDQSFSDLVGLLVEIDTAADEGVRFVLEFYRQFDTVHIPTSGYLFVHQNDTQLKIRQNVSKSIYRGKTPAKYMYRTFHDFSVAGYEELENHPGLVDFLHKRMGQQFPPNQMQLEAIVKGILTEDMLLVLGPPGTGKTTVILSWVEYFLSQGKRVLISSQNNSAVDNVLERLGEDKSREIVRLGREEKVQENCKQYIPYYLIGTMRNTCESNGNRLEKQLSRELSQIDAYIDALRQLRELMHSLEDVVKQLYPLTQLMDRLSSSLKTCDAARKKARSELTFSEVQAEKYKIYLEESDKKGILERLFQFGQRHRAKAALTQLNQQIPALKAELSKKEQLYSAHCRDLQRALQNMRSDDLLEGHNRLRQQVSALQAQIPELVPTFESELKATALLSTYTPPTAKDLQRTAFLADEISRMEQARTSANKILTASRQWVNAALKGDRNEVFEEILLEACQVVGATCIGINSNKLFRDVNFDVTIIDESGQIQLQNALVPMSRSPKTLMLGDYKQIPPIVNDEIVKSCQLEDISTELFEQSFFEYLFEKMRQKELQRLVDKPQQWLNEELPADAAQAKQRCTELARAELLKPRAEDYVGKPVQDYRIEADGTLKTVYRSRYTTHEVAELVAQITRDRKKIVNLNSQFRMPGNISDVISEWFYESNYYSSYDMSRFKPVVPGTDLPRVIIDTSGIRGRFETQPDNKMGYQNPMEAELVADVLQAVLSGLDEKGQQEYVRTLDKRLGVISAYGAQVRYIRQSLRKRLGLSNSEASTAVASLDSFQGQERDLIIYSLTRSSRKHPEQARVGFLKELRRLNVAFTRCKKQLVIIGDMDYLLSCLYVQKDMDRDSLPCAGTSDSQITQLHVNQCAECQADCERRFSRFFRLLMQHTKADPPAGNLIPAAKLHQVLKGE